MTSRRNALLAALRDAHPMVRSKAVEALDRLDLLESLPSKAPTLRSLGRAEAVGFLRSLVGLRDEDSLKTGLRGLEHPDEEVRVAALEVAESCNDWRASAVVARRLSDSSPVVRARAAEALGKLADRRRATELVEALADPSPGVVARAVEALGLLAHAPAEPLLLPLLSHPDSDVRAAAAEALGRLGFTQGP